MGRGWVWWGRGEGSRRCVEALWHKGSVMWYVGAVLCGEESDTLPKGMVERSRERYVASRLGLSTVAVRAYSEKFEQWHTLCTRVMERSCAISMIVLWTVLRRMEAFSMVALWTVHLRKQ